MNLEKPTVYHLWYIYYSYTLCKQDINFKHKKSGNFYFCVLINALTKPYQINLIWFCSILITGLNWFWLKFAQIDQVNFDFELDLESIQSKPSPDILFFVWSILKFKSMSAINFSHTFYGIHNFFVTHFINFY